MDMTNIIHTTINELVRYPRSYLNSAFYLKVISDDGDKQIINSTRNLKHSDQEI